MVPGTRAVAVGEQLRRLLGPVLLHEVNDPRLRNLNISQITLSADLRHARVYLCSADSLDDSRKAEIRNGLSKCTSYLRGVLGARSGLRFVPQLRFEFDDTAERAERIEALLDRN